MNIQQFLSDKISSAMSQVNGESSPDAIVRPAAKKQFGDYQANGMMVAAKKSGTPPRQFAEQVLNHLNLEGIAHKVEIAGPGFINLFLEPSWMAAQLQQMQADTNLNINKPLQQQTIVVDYSAPNVAKEMHVGHLRSTIIGDATVRVLSFLGHHVIRANHIGDWGTQFGMLIAYLEKIENEQAENLDLADLETFYRQAKQHYDQNEQFAERARNYVVKLQGGDPYCARMWQKLIDITMTQNIATYRRLNVSLSAEDTMGESLYNAMLPEIVADLKARHIAVENDGATVVYLDEFKNKEGQPMGVIIQKRDGGYLYSTTDIACIKYRYTILHADRILYYTDSRQHQHLQQVWLIAHKAGYIPPTLQLEHHMFGMIQGKDGKPFKTRSGDTIKLSDLLDEAVSRARQLIESREPKEFDQQQLANLAQVIGISAVKYADLSKNRTTDYIFDWDNMLAFEGNTAPYLLYAYTRIASIFRKAGIASLTAINYPLQLADDKERALAMQLLQFEEVIDNVAKEGLPHLICGYLYDTANLFSSFYEHCPILTAENEQIKHSRLTLAALTAKVLKTGLDLLGIETVEKM